MHPVTAVTTDELDLAATLLSGQAFRWWPKGDSFRGFLAGIPVRVRVAGAPARVLLVEWSAEAGGDGDAGRREQTVKDYFDLARDYRAIRLGAAAAHPWLAPALEFSRGLRVLRQDPWEALVSFIASQNNNIPRIARVIASICSRGPGFPGPHDLARLGEERLKAHGLGYRAKYVAAAARMVASGAVDFGAMRSMATEEAKRVLLTIPGVGEKVADCVLLYGMQRYEAAPVDIWVKRFIESVAFGGRQTSIAVVRSWVAGNLGPYAGIIQAHLYHYARSVGRNRHAAP
jgi:N-glycosylase/DNA lyase